MLRRALLILFFALAGCGTTTIGDHCDERDDCSAIPDSYCALTQICVAECAEAGTPCSVEGRCVDAYGRLVCLPVCSSNDDCRDVDRCIDGACVLRDGLAEP